MPEPATSASERKRARILDAAAALFAAQGYAKTTVDEIAAAAGVSKGLIYVHYASKEDLLLAVWTREVAAWTRATEDSVKLAAGSVADAIGATLRGSIDHARENTLLAAILSQDPGSLLPFQREGVAAFARGYREKLELVLEFGRRSGEQRKDLDVRYTAELIWLVHHSLVRELFLASPRGWRPDGDALLRAAIELVVAGLRAPL